MDITIVDIIGYAASFFVALSLTMRDFVKLRGLNFIGCGLFIIYGVMISSWPIILTNAFIACANVYFLFNMYAEKQSSGKGF